MPIRYTVRQYVRLAVEYPVYYMGPDFLGHGRVREMSLTGWHVEGDTAVYPGMLLTLAVSLPDDPTAIRVEQALVRWAREGAFGLRTVKIAPEESARLHRAVMTLLPQQFSSTSLLHDARRRTR